MLVKFLERAIQGRVYIWKFVLVKFVLVKFVQAKDPLYKVFNLLHKISMYTDFVV